MLTMLHENPVRVDGKYVVVDRKFATGMENYVRNVRSQLATIHPAADADTRIMDPIRLPIDSLGYVVSAVSTSQAHSLDTHRAMAEQICASILVYGSADFGIRIARAKGVPYILIREYDLRTRMVVAANSVLNPMRRAARVLKCLYARNEDIRQLRGAYEIHCNGYPIYEETGRYNSHRLLYFDSRMAEDMLIKPDILTKRLTDLYSRKTVKFIYSGRYERIKGADDVVKVAALSIGRGVDMELDCYGQGSLRDCMATIAGQYPNRIRIHDSLAYPELVLKSQSFDAFVCCHVQNDPSCTYLEAFGAGLPIIGYANRMWKGLFTATEAGAITPVGDTEAMASALHTFIQQKDLVRDMSCRARDFAAAHAFELEFNRRTDALNSALEQIGDRVAGQINRPHDIG